mgnify:CR=1 FL=1
MAESVAAQVHDDDGRRDVDDSTASVLIASEYALFAQVGRARRVEAGQQLFRRGDLGTSMFVIASGAIELDFGEDLVAKRLGAREFFGELGLLIGDHARSADATMVEDGVLLELGRHEFDLLAQRDPQLLSHFLRRAIMRVVYNEQGLIARLRRRNQELQTALDTLRATAHRLNQTEVLTRTDELTGLANRRGFAGDRVLQSVANLLRAVSGPDDIACRLGGDEFCLLVAGRQVQHIARMANYIVASARTLRQMQTVPPQITTLSIGACVIGDDEHDWEHWYAHADTALYRAKRLGGDRVEWQD